jgi:putative phosphoesterase
MRIAVLADIHANIQALTAVLRDCETQRVDGFWLLGDYVDYGASAIETISLLSSLDAEYVIAGNHDACLFNSAVRSSATPHGKLSHEYTKRIVLDDLKTFEWLKSIADTPTIHIVDRNVFLVHGTPSNPYWGKFRTDEEVNALFDEMEQFGFRTMLMGHSHVSYMRTKAGRTIINPGSVGQPRNGYPEAAYAIMEDDTVMFRRAKYDIDAAANEIRSAGLPEYLWRRLYDGV